MNPGRSDVLGEHAANPPTGSSGFGGGAIATAFCPTCRWIAPIIDVNKNCTRARKETVGCLGRMVLKEWKCSALEDRITAQFEQEVRRRARAAYLDVLSSPDPQDQLEGQRMADKYTDDFAAGAYNWDDDDANITNHCKAARMKTWGTLLLTWLCMRRVDDKVTEAQAKEVFLANPTEAMRTYLWILGVAKNDQPPFLMTGSGGQRPSDNGGKESSPPRESQPPPQPDQIRTVNLPPAEPTFG